MTVPLDTVLQIITRYGDSTLLNNTDTFRLICKIPTNDKSAFDFNNHTFSDTVRRYHLCTQLVDESNDMIDTETATATWSTMAIAKTVCSAMGIVFKGPHLHLLTPHDLLDTKIVDRNFRDKLQTALAYRTEWLCEHQVFRTDAQERSHVMTNITSYIYYICNTPFFRIGMSIVSLLVNEYLRLTGPLCYAKEHIVAATAGYFFGANKNQGHVRIKCLAILSYCKGLAIKPAESDESIFNDLQIGASKPDSSIVDIPHRCKCMIPWIHYLVCDNGECRIDFICLSHLLNRTNGCELYYIVTDLDMVTAHIINQQKIYHTKPSIVMGLCSYQMYSNEELEGYLHQAKEYYRKELEFNKQ